MEDFFSDFKQMNHNTMIHIMNQLFVFRKEKMPDESMLDVITEFANKNDYNPVQLAQELSEFEGFQKIVEQDCKKFKYSKIVDYQDNNDWN